MTGAKPHVQLQALCKRYGADGRQTPVLDRVTASVAKGQFVVVLGRSGSGKSTLLNLVGGIDLPDAGEVTIDGRSLNTLADRERTLLRRRRIGFIFQAYNLIPTLTVRENLLLPQELNGQRGMAAERGVAAWLEAVGLDARGAAYPDELSGGEQQRVAVARALVHDPDLILADEPTGSLDLETAHQVLALLDDLCRRGGKTLIMATHSREVMGLADRVLSIRAGRLVELPP